MIVIALVLVVCLALGMFTDDEPGRWWDA